jgi:hypothetical protein
MSITISGTFSPGDYTLVKFAHKGDLLGIKNDGPGTVYITSDSVGDDQKVSAQTFIAWRVENPGSGVSMNVQTAVSAVTLTWARNKA